ncbi:unnamed protein product [Vicia faba]|uniref:Uncharacterized protein n=1 Tax=Vicia faba TaxID=3906 RepID=A0AAV1APW4_VICFA|nr:unnamed protein product [Vicia faba]
MNSIVERIGIRFKSRKPLKVKKMKMLEGLCRERGDIEDEGYAESKIDEAYGDALRIVQREKRFSGEFFLTNFLRSESYPTLISDFQFFLLLAGSFSVKGCNYCKGKLMLSHGRFKDGRWTKGIVFFTSSMKKKQEDI